MPVNWNNGIAPDAGNALLQGFEHGRQTGERIKHQNALSAYAMNPDDPQALAGIAPYEPQLVMQQREQQKKEQMAQQQADIRRRAFDGDKQAARELFQFDDAAWSKLDATQKAQIEQSVDFVGQTALQIDMIPDEGQRAAAWQNAVQQAEARGMDIPTEYERYSPDVLRNVISEAKLAKELMAQNEPKTFNLTQGGSVAQMDKNGAMRILVAPNEGQGNLGDPVGGGSNIPPAAIAELRGDPTSAAEFDQIFGAGAAQRVLGGGAGNGAGNFPG